jgi:hypothetical protein
VRFKVLTAMKILMVVFWVVTLCALVGGHQRSEEHTSMFSVYVL